MDYERYTFLHQLATEYQPDQLEVIRQPNGLVEEGNTRNYTFHALLTLTSREARLERLVALKEMSGERYNNLPLFQYWPTDVEQSPPQGITLERAKAALPEAISIGHRYEPYGPNCIVISPLYSKKESPKLVNAILKSYYMGREVPDQTPFDRLREIARHIRAVHTMHPKRDGNGRTNLKGLLNMWLEEEGFSPIISPVKPAAFRGDRTLNGLVEDILTGMHDFIKVVDTCKREVGEPNPQATFQGTMGESSHQPEQEDPYVANAMWAFRNP